MQNVDERIQREHEGFVATEDIELYTVDATAFGGGQYHFTPAPVLADDGSRVAPTFGGITYTVVPMESEGWDWSSGELPKPLVRFHIAQEVGNLDSRVAALFALLEQFDDLVGAKAYRTITKRRFLDDGSDPDPSAHMGVEVYEIVQKAAQQPTLLEMRLSSALDVEGVMLPAGQILSRCRFRYRVPDGQGGFSMRSCQYAGASMFDAQGNPVADPALDRCGKQLSDCRLRFGETETLPFGGFPGAGRIGVT
ncbi:phage minor tail protein L [Thalassovita sp.]|uniref:phage minor tail protein L n=1 Tax=Thalassovita sp. TaxID=1979401 RepID=UPI002AAF1CFA|nr:phage minor tail protein L [Thalassovita sp.]